MIKHRLAAFFSVRNSLLCIAQPEAAIWCSSRPAGARVQAVNGKLSFY